MKEAMFELLKEALNQLYAPQMVEGGYIQRIAEYDPNKHTAPNIVMEKRTNPKAVYIATIEYNNEKESGCVSCLGGTVCDAIELALSKLKTKH